jgi:hypothetical protein
MSLPPLPDGATLDSPSATSGGMPPLPEGATLDAPTAQHTVYDPTEGMSTTDKFLAGAGKGLVDTGRGVYQLGASIGHAAGMVSDEKMAQIQSDVDEAHGLDKPLMDTTAGKVGDVVGTAAPALLMPGAGIVGGAAAGAAMGAAQPVPTGESRLQNAGMGAVGGGVGGAIGKVFKAFGGFGVPMERQAAVDTLTKEGIPLSVAQKTTAKGAQTIERASGMISDAQNEFMGQQQPAFNRAVLRRVGVNDQNVTAATPDVLSGAKTKITGFMDDVAKSGLKVDDGMLNGLGEVENDALSKLPDSDLGPIKKHITDILGNAAKNDGSLDGTFYQKVRSSLGDLSTDHRYAPIAHDMQDVLDDALARQNPEDAARLATARQQYRALKYQITPAVDSNGNVSVPKLMSTLMNKSNRNQTLYGQGDQSLVDLAKAANKVIPDRLGNSGTPERLLAPLTVMEGLRQEGGLFRTAVKAAMAVYGGGAMSRVMRNQGAIGDIAASGVPGLRAAGPLVNQVAPKVGYAAAEATPRDADAEQPDFSIQRASGGKVDKDALVERLMRRWKAAKTETDKTTKPLLTVPDDTIANALHIAGRVL